MFRVNRPTPTEGILINRLITWSTITEQLFEITAEGVRQKDRAFAVQLDLDISTDAYSTGMIPAQKVPLLILAMKEHFIHSADKGDCP
jgi:hypothetical protein